MKASESRFAEGASAVVAWCVRFTVLILPAILLFLAQQRYGELQPLLVVGGAFTTIVVLGIMSVTRFLEQPAGPQVITIYLSALTWLWLGDRATDWYHSLAKAVMIVVPIMVFGSLVLVDSGAPLLRRANRLAERIAARKNWPTGWMSIRAMPEVKAFQSALVMDAAPALALLRHRRLEVRIAALSALEFRRDWRPGQAEYILQIAQRADDPNLRCAAMTALANVEDRVMIETVANFLTDGDQNVRKAVASALLWDCETRWPWIRFALRRHVGDPRTSEDGPLLPDGALLPYEAVKDLTGWCAEKGLVSARASAMLAVHYDRALTQRLDGSLAEELRKQLQDPHTTAVLRLELGRVLQAHKELPADVLERLLDSSNPATLRMIACETILSGSTNSMIRAEATQTLRDLGRLPNREIALAAADVVQRRLEVDLGLALGQPLPAVHSKQAQEVNKRLLQWINMYSEEEAMEKSGAM